jgi:hypothetical protein
MKDLKQIVKECNISFSDIKQDYKPIYDLVFFRETDWLCNAEEKTYRLPEYAKKDIDLIISRLKEQDYVFTSIDTPQLSNFVSKINTIIRIANRINNFKEGKELDNGKRLNLFELFNTIKKTEKLNELDFELNKNLNSFIPHLFSVIKHCQDPDNYPIYYRYWKNLLGEVLNQKDDYDSLCEFYKNIENPKHNSLGAYFGAIGTILAEKITKNKIIQEEGDKNYRFIKSNLLNIHYFDLITGYKRKPYYYLIGSKYGPNNDIDVFPEMKESSVVSVGFAAGLDLNEFYLTDENEIKEYLKEENQSQNAINALKYFLNIKIGDKVAVKASGSPKGNKGFLSIIGIGEVIPDENGAVYNYDPDGLGHTINVKYTNLEYRELELGGYGSTVHKLSNKDHIKMIFKGENKTYSMNYKDEFSKWLAKNNSEGSNKPGSYIKSIDILSEILNKNLFEEDDLIFLKSLYADLKIEQTKVDGKYYYPAAPSYGESRFYSASIGSYMEFLQTLSTKLGVSEPITNLKVRVNNKLAQAICVIGDSGVGKTYRIAKTLEKENHKKLFVIIDSMWQHLLFDYSPNDRKYNLTKIGEFIKKAQDDLENHYTIVIDECHKNLEIINDVLLQAISTKRNEGVRFLSINSVVDHQFDFLPESDGNRILPSNLGFIFISSKSDLIEGNDDLKNRIEIIELNETDQNDKDYSIEYLLKKVKEIEDSEYTN